MCLVKKLGHGAVAVWGLNPEFSPVTQRKHPALIHILAEAAVQRPSTARYSVCQIRNKSWPFAAVFGLFA